MDSDVSFVHRCDAEERDRKTENAFIIFWYPKLRSMYAKQNDARPRFLPSLLRLLLIS